jgi:hypothetical protein
MKKLAGMLKKAAVRMKKHNELFMAAQSELNALHEELCAALGAKLNSITGKKYSPLKSYKWEGRLETVCRSQRKDGVGLVLATKYKRSGRDPLKTFLGDVLVVLGNVNLPLQPGVTLRNTYEGWEIRFNDRYDSNSYGVELSVEQCRDYIEEHRLCVGLSSAKQGDYRRAKQFIAECDTAMALLRKEKK